MNEEVNSLNELDSNSIPKQQIQPLNLKLIIWVDLMLLVEGKIPLLEFGLNVVLGS